MGLHGHLADKGSDTLPPRLRRKAHMLHVTGVLSLVSSACTFLSSTTQTTLTTSSPVEQESAASTSAFGKPVRPETQTMPGLLLPNAASSSTVPHTSTASARDTMPSATSSTASSTHATRKRPVATSRRSGRHDPIGALISAARQKRQDTLSQKLATLRTIANTQNLLDNRLKKGRTSAKDLIDAMWMEGKPSTGAVRAYFDADRELQRFDEIIAPKLWIELAKYPATHLIFSSGSASAPATSGTPKIHLNGLPELPTVDTFRSLTPTMAVEPTSALLQPQSLLEVPHRNLKRARECSPEASQSSTDVEPDFMSNPPMTTQDLSKVVALLAHSTLAIKSRPLTRSSSVDTVVEQPPAKKPRTTIAKETPTRNPRSTRGRPCA